MTRTALAMAALLAGLAALSGCGLRGSLERPVPLWGNPPNEGPNDPRTIKAAEEKAAADEKAKEDAERAARQAGAAEAERDRRTSTTTNEPAAPAPQ